MYDRLFRKTEISAIINTYLLLSPAYEDSSRGQTADKLERQGDKMIIKVNVCPYCGSIQVPDRSKEWFVPFILEILKEKHQIKTYNRKCDDCSDRHSSFFNILFGEGKKWKGLSSIDKGFAVCALNKLLDIPLVYSKIKTIINLEQRVLRLKVFSQG